VFGLKKSATAAKAAGTDASQETALQEEEQAPEKMKEHNCSPRLGLHPVVFLFKGVRTTGGSIQVQSLAMKPWGHWGRVLGDQDLDERRKAFKTGVSIPTSDCGPHPDSKGPNCLRKRKKSSFCEAT